MFGISKMNWNRIGFFVAGTFLGGWVIGTIGRVLNVGK